MKETEGWHAPGETRGWMGEWKRKKKRKISLFYTFCWKKKEKKENWGCYPLGSGLIFSILQKIKINLKAHIWHIFICYTSKIVEIFHLYIMRHSHPQAHVKRDNMEPKAENVIKIFFLILHIYRENISLLMWTNCFGCFKSVYPKALVFTKAERYMNNMADTRSSLQSWWNTLCLIWSVMEPWRPTKTSPVVPAIKHERSVRCSLIEPVLLPP